MSAYNPAVRTRALARIVGPYLVIVAAVLFVRQSVLPRLLIEFMRDDPLVFATEAFTLLAGLTLGLASSLDGPRPRL